MDDETFAETIARAISLKVLADAPDSRGPFVLEVRHKMTPGDMEHILRVWKGAFERAGRPSPPLLVLEQQTAEEPFESKVLEAVKDATENIEADHARFHFLARHAPRCPACGADQVMVRLRPAPAQWKCRMCKHRWEWEPANAK